MSLTEPSDKSSVDLSLSEGPAGPAQPSPWVGSLVALGAKISEQVGMRPGRQLIVAISVPSRDFAAILVGCGWIMAGPEPKLDAPISVLRQLQPHTPVRVVTSNAIIADYFIRLDEESNPPRMHVGPSEWQVSKVRAIAVLNHLEVPARTPRHPMSLVGPSALWDARLANPTADLAIIGTLTWLQEELTALIGPGDSSAATAGNSTDPAQRDRAWSEPLVNPDRRTSLGDIIMPASSKSATSFTQLFSSVHVATELPFRDDIHLAILDGSAAIRHLAEIGAAAVICIIDRSVADETAAEIVVQLRNSRGEPISAYGDLGWKPPAGVEVMAFTVAL